MTIKETVTTLSGAPQLKQIFGIGVNVTQKKKKKKKKKNFFLYTAFLNTVHE